MHALNMSWLMLGYDQNQQWYKDNYLHSSIAGVIKVGLHGQQFFNRLIVPHFKNPSSYCGNLMPWDILCTDYS
jgi:hypothetical protein